MTKQTFTEDQRVVFRYGRGWNSQNWHEGRIAKSKDELYITYKIKNEVQTRPLINCIEVKDYDEHTAVTPKQKQITDNSCTQQELKANRSVKCPDRCIYLNADLYQINMTLNKLNLNLTRYAEALERVAHAIEQSMRNTK